MTCRSVTSLRNSQLSRAPSATPTTVAFGNSLITALSSFAHFPEKRLLPALGRRARINGVQTIAILVQQADGPSHSLLIPPFNSQHTRSIDTNANGFDAAPVQVIRQGILPSLPFGC